MQKITPEYLKSLIVKVEYHRVPDTTATVCSLILKNSVVVNGESACVDPAHFNAQLGEEYAYNDAFKKLGDLEGYRAKMNALNLV